MAWGHPTVWEGRKGGRSATKKQKRPDGAWPDQADRTERGGGGRVAETEREIKTERLIDRQTEKEGDREICSSSWKTFYQSLFGWFDLGSSLGKRGRWEGLGPQCETKTVYYIKKGGGGQLLYHLIASCCCLLWLTSYKYTFARTISNTYVLKKSLKHLSYRLQSLWSSFIFLKVFFFFFFF